MSKRELLNQIKSLSPRERAKLVEAVLALEVKPKPAASRNRRVKWPDVEARARRILGKKVLPNLVMLERETQLL
jgi:hypothetical protein